MVAHIYCAIQLSEIIPTHDRTVGKGCWLKEEVWVEFCTDQQSSFDLKVDLMAKIDADLIWDVLRWDLGHLIVIRWWVWVEVFERE